MVRGFNSSSGEVTASISGTLCRSEAWDAKLERDRAAVKDERTHCRYGRSDWDWFCGQSGIEAADRVMLTMVVGWRVVVRRDRL